MQLSIDSWTDIWKTAFLCNLSDKLSGSTNLYTAEDLSKALNHFNNTFKLSHSYPVMLQGNFLWDYNVKTDLNVDIQNHIEGNSVINEILNIGNGKISLCGGSIVGIISKLLGGNSNSGDYDFFFHCDTDEANFILEKCINVISKYFDNLSNHNQYWVPIYTRNYKVTSFSTPYIKIQFIMKLYHNKSRILLGFDMPGCQFGYNSKDSLFMTLQGLIAFVTKSYPVDLTQRCNAYESRLAKYYKKGYTIILPGLGGNWESFQNRKLMFKKAHISNTYIMTMVGNSLDPSGYEPSESILGITQSPLYFKFHSRTPEGLFILEDGDILLTLDNTTGYQGYIPKVESRLTLEYPNAFCEDDDNAKDFLGKERYNSLRTHNRRSAIFKSAWNEAKNEWKTKAFELASHLRLSKWELDDLASKDFGKFNPVPPEHNEWYSGRYNSVLIGIGQNEMQALMDCRKNVEYIASLPHELFKLICYYWFNAEVRDASTHIKYLFALAH
jgi:hypothetical protein